MILYRQHPQIIKGYWEKTLVEKLLHVKFGDQKIAVIPDGVVGDQPVHKFFGAARIRRGNAPDPG